MGGIHGDYFTLKTQEIRGFPGAKTAPDSSCRSQPAAAGLQVFCGILQSMPSSK
jgi:hypothetical protein